MGCVIANLLLLLSFSENTPTYLFYIETKQYTNISRWNPPFFFSSSSSSSSSFLFFYSRWLESDLSFGFIVLFPLLVLSYFSIVLHIWPFQVAALVPQFEVDLMIGSTFLDIQSLKMTQAHRKSITYYSNLETLIVFLNQIEDIYLLIFNLCVYMLLFYHFYQARNSFIFPYYHLFLGSIKSKIRASVWTCGWGHVGMPLPWNSMQVFGSSYCN